MTEFVIIMTLLLFFTLGLLQIVFIYQAKTNLNYATYEAARAAAMDHASPTAVRAGFTRALAPSLVRVSGSRSEANASDTERNLALVNAIKKARLEFDSYVKVQRINPTSRMFATNSGWGKSIPQWKIRQENLSGIVSLYIPNENLLYQNATRIKQGVNIQDANLLKIHTTYCKELIVPFANRFIQSAYRLVYHDDNNMFTTDTPPAERALSDSFINRCLNSLDADGNREYRIPIVATSIMRMQSDAWNYQY